MKHTKDRKKIVIILASIIVVILLIIGISYAFYENSQKQILLEEVSRIHNNKEINNTIKAKGKYGEMEEAIKSYFLEYDQYNAEYALAYKESGLSKALVASNYEEDGPEFTKTREKIEQMKQINNNYKEKLTEMTSQEYIDQRADEMNLNKKEKEIFQNALPNEEEVKSYLSQCEAIESYIQKVEEILQLLREYKGLWKVNGNSVQFSTQELVNKYTELVEEAKNIIEEITT